MVLSQGRFRLPRSCIVADKRGLCRYDFYQNPTHLTLSIYIKGYGDAGVKEGVKVDFEVNKVCRQLFSDSMCLLTRTLDGHCSSGPGRYSSEDVFD